MTYFSGYRSRKDVQRISASNRRAKRTSEEREKVHRSSRAVEVMQAGLPLLIDNCMNLSRPAEYKHTLSRRIHVVAGWVVAETLVKGSSERQSSIGRLVLTENGRIGLGVFVKRNIPALEIVGAVEPLSVRGAEELSLGDVPEDAHTGHRQPYHQIIEEKISKMLTNVGIEFNYPNENR